MPHTTQTSDFWGWYLRHNNREIWKYLSDAGIDVFASGPSNNPQAFLDLTNILPSMSGGFSRRWGTTVYQSAATATVTNPVRTFIYSVPQDLSNPSNTANTNLWITTDNQNFNTFTDSGVLSAGYVPTNFASAGNVNAVTSREWFYYGNGVNSPRKIQLNNTTTNTDNLNGIAVPYNSSTGPGTPSTTDFTRYPNVVTIEGHTGLGYSVAGPPNVTVFDAPGGSGSGAVITATYDSYGRVDNWTIVSPGSNYSCAYAVVTPPPAGGRQAYLTLYTQINPNAPNYGEVIGIDPGGPMSYVVGRRYGVALQNSLTGHTSDVAMATFTPAVGTGATFTNWAQGPQSGLEFNTLTEIYQTQQQLGLIDTFPIYAIGVNNIGQQITAGYTQLSLSIYVPDSLDPQVDTVVLMASSDGGSIGTLYEVEEIPLSSFTHYPTLGYYALGHLAVGAVPASTPYYDTLPDSYNNSTGIYTTQSSLIYGTLNTLLASNLWALTDQNGDTFGILLNTPPTPTGFLYPTLHQGRMFATDGKTVFYSKSLDEVTTATGLITSKWEECWPGDYQLPVALNNETILGLKSDGTNLHIGTEKSIFTLYGSDPSSFSIPAQAFAETGILSNDCWSVVYAEGIPAGYVWITQDLKIMHSDFSTYREIGTPIYPKLQLLDLTKIQYNKVLSLTQGPYNFVILQLFMTGSSSPQPEFWIWESRLGKWYHWVLSVGASSVVGSSFVYQTPAFSSSSLASGSKYLFFWNYKSSLSPYFWSNYFNPSAIQDQGIGSGGVANFPISWSVQTSWQDLGDSTSIKTVNEIEFTSDETLPINVALYGATSQAQFDSGGTLLKSGTSVTGPINALGVNKFYCAGTPTAAKYYSLRFSPNTVGTSSSVLTSFAIESYPMARI